MPENCDASCVKTIINTRLIAYIAALLAETAGDGHPLFQMARILAAAARAACEAYAVAIEEGALTRAPGRSGWNGCDEAETLMSIVNGLRSGDQVPMQTAKRTLLELTDRANATTLRLVKRAA